jgi:hypothetical protein
LAVAGAPSAAMALVAVRMQARAAATIFEVEMAHRVI